MPEATTGVRLEGPPSGAEKIFGVLVLLLNSGAFSTLTVREGLIGKQTGGSPTWQVFWVFMYLAALGLLYRHCPGFLRQILKEWPLVALGGLAVLSTAWSDDPALTFRRGVVLCLTIMFGFYLARRFSLREQLHILAWVCGICVFFSYPFGLLHIGKVVEVIPGAWHGIFVQKNDLGRMVAFSAFVFLVLGRAEPVHRWRMRLGVLASLVLVVLSHSATAIVVTALMLMMLPVCGILRKSLGKALAGMAFVAIAGGVALLWVFTHLATFTDALGRTVTLSGRLQLWALCIVMALRKPWLGYGYNAFWLGMNGPSWRIWRALGVQMPHAHNGFIQVWLELGLVGVGLFVLCLVLYSARGALLVRRNSQPEAAWPLLIMAFSFLYILTEITIPSGNPIFMMVFSSCAYTASFSSLGVERQRRHLAVNRHAQVAAQPGMNASPTN